MRPFAALFDQITVSSLANGGPGSIAMSLKALAVGGHLSLIGASLAKSRAGLDPLLLTGHGITLAWAFASHYSCPRISTAAAISRCASCSVPTVIRR